MTKQNISFPKVASGFYILCRPTPSNPTALAAVATTIIRTPSNVTGSSAVGVIVWLCALVVALL